MALTADQNIALHQILDVPLKSRVFILLGEDNINYQERTMVDSVRAVNVALESYLLTLSTDETTRLKEYLDEWYTLGINTTTLDGGSTGGVAGVTDSPNADREEIIRQVKVIVPFYRAHLEIENAMRNSPFVGIER